MLGQKDRELVEKEKPTMCVMRECKETLMKAETQDLVVRGRCAGL